jgi:hypothetical protein
METMRALRIFAVSNPEGEREFYWIMTPDSDLTDEELEQLVDRSEWHGPFASEIEAKNDQYRVVDGDDGVIFPEDMTIRFQPDKSASGKYVFHAIGDSRLFAVITIDREVVNVQPANEGGLPEWALRQLGDGALDFMKAALSE